MTKSKLFIGGALAALIAAAPGCKKDEGKGKGAPKTAEPKATDVKAEPPKVEPPKPMTSDELAKFYAGCWDALGAKDEAKMAACYGDDLTSEILDSGMPAMTGKAARMDNIKAFWTGFADMKGTSALTLVSGKKIASISLITGTHSGEFKMGPQAIPATNKKVGYFMGHVAEFGEDNVAHKEWSFIDQGTMMNQLGLSPQPGRPVTEAMTGEPAVVIATDSDAEKANVEAHKKAIEAWNGGDAKAVAAMYAPDAVVADYTQPKDMVGPKDAVKFMGMVKKGFPDAKGEVLDLWAAGDYTVAVMKNGGTNTGDVKEWKLKKTGKPISFTGLEIYKWENGKMKAGWAVANGMAIPMQLGLIPMPGAPADGAAPEGDKAAPEGDKAAPAAPAKK